jgi:predicted ATPase
MVVERERLHVRALEALGHLAAHHEGNGAYEQAIAYARRQVELEPWRESAHRQWMRALAASGQRGAALAQYEACRRILAQELGIEPEPETVALYERIRSGGELSVSGVTPPHNLPAQLTPFIGREALLAEIAKRLSDPACRLLTLVGPGGSGKTRLALEAAAQQLKAYPDGVFVVSLAPLQSVEAIVPAIAQALSFRFYGAGEPREQLLNYLRRKEMLLVLDNYEHLLEGAWLAAEILRAAPGVRIVVTSRAGLRVQGEHRFPVSGMSYPALADIPRNVGRRQGEGALQYSAVQLFTAGARRARPDFELTDDNVADVVRICQGVEGLPLALLLAAAWIEMLTPAEIAAEIERSLDVLETDQCGAPERQRSIRAVFEHSWQLLPPRGPEILAGLSVFRGGFTREAASEVTGASLRDLMSLVNRSLIHRTVEGRFETHELLRQYAAEMLDRSPEASGAVHDAYCAYYTAALDRWAAGLKGARQQAAVAEMDEEIENAHTAWVWAVERGRVERLDQAMKGLGLYYERRARYEEGEAAFRAAADRLAEVETGRVRIAATTWQAQFNRYLGRPEIARPLLQQSLDLLSDPGFADQDLRLEKAFVLHEMAYIEHWSGSNERARQSAAQSLSLCRTVGDRWATAKALSALGRIMQILGEYEEARRLHEEALEIRRALGDQRGITESLDGAGVALSNLGQLDAAEQLLREGVTITRGLGDRTYLSERLWRFGLMLGARGKFVESLSVMEEGLELLGESRSPIHLAFAHQGLGIAETNLGHYQEARIHLQKGIDLFRTSGHLWGIGFTRFLLAKVALAEEQYGDAQRLLRETVAGFQETSVQSDLGRPLASLIRAAYGLGRLNEAHQHLCAALQICIEVHDMPTSTDVLPMAALLLADGGRVERAVELYALASRYPHVANSRWVEDVAGKHIAAAATTLPPEVVAAAQERGRARDLWATVEELLAELGPP